MGRVRGGVCLPWLLTGLVRHSSDSRGDRRGCHHSGPRVWVPIALLGLYMAALDRRWPIPIRRTAWAIGGVWTALTALFGVGLGRFVARNSWAEILEQYDLPHGRVWVLVPLWTAVGPAAVRELRTRRLAADRGGYLVPHACRGRWVTHVWEAMPRTVRSRGRGSGREGRFAPT
jgi:hypothetical protein